jgi:hypothetical protein
MAGAQPEASISNEKRGVRSTRALLTLAQAAASVALAACGGGASYDAVAGDTTIPGAAATSASTPTPSSGGTAFQTRCAQPGVIKCVGFDDLADFNIGSGGTSGAYGLNDGIFAPSGTTDYTRATRDTAVKASGNSSLKFTIPSTSGADSSGSYFTNFSKDLSVQFGENSEFFIQWRQRFSPDFVGAKYAGGGGWKQIIIGTGDQPGQLYTSCTALETVVQNTLHRGFPQMYNSCEGSASHGPYDPFEEPFGTYDFKLENGRPSPYCLYSQSKTSYFAPTGNCFGYVANEWLTFQVRIKTGPRIGNEFVNSYVTMWVAREGKSSELVINWGPYNLSAGSASQNQKFGKVWLLPYNTGRDPSMTYPTAYVWYDELIISRNQIGDP